jgi:hypothetical protein
MLAIAARCLVLALLLLSTAHAAPCDIFAAGGTPCVAAHSTVRALFAGAAGPLYQVAREHDGARLDVLPLGPGGFANTAALDAFCAGAECTVTKIYDQTALGNTLNVSRSCCPTCCSGHAYWMKASNATRFDTTASGKKVYGLWIDVGEGYRLDNTTGMPLGTEPQTIYMVADGTHVNGACCFDYGNAEVDEKDDGRGRMSALYFGTNNVSAKGWCGGSGEGPWAMIDIENGIYGGNCTASVNPANIPLPFPFVTAMVKDQASGFALKGADATTGSLHALYNGPRPKAYPSLLKQGSLILGIGGDDSHSGVGTFFEGAVVNGISSDATDALLAKDIESAGYGK